MEKLTIMSRYRSESCFCHSLLHVWFLQGSIFTVPVGICEECLQGFHKRSPKDVKCSTCRFSLRTEKIGNRRDRVFFTECRACKFKFVSLLSLFPLRAVTLSPFQGFHTCPTKNCARVAKTIRLVGLLFSVFPLRKTFTAVKGQHDSKQFFVTSSGKLPLYFMSFLSIEDLCSSRP